MASLYLLAGVWYSLDNFNLRSFRDFVLFALVIIGVILLSSNVFSANILPPTPVNNCWNFIACESYTDANINSDDNKEICIISNLTTEHSDTNAIIIEIYQGGVNSDRHHYFIYNTDSANAGIRDYFFEMSKDTAPTYVLCSMYNPLELEHYTAGKLEIIDRWMSTTNITHTTTKNYLEILDDDNISKYLFGVILSLIAIAIIYFSIYSIIKGR